MLDINEYVKDLVNSGFSKDEAIKNAKGEIEKRKLSKPKQIEKENKNSDWFRKSCDRYKR